MPESQNDLVLRTALAPARGLEPTGAEVEAVLARSGSRRARASAPRSARRSRNGWRLVLPALACLVLLLAGAYAVPPTRAAIDDAVSGVTGIFDDWSADEEAQAPGRAVTLTDSAPSYFDDGAWSGSHVKGPRVLAEAGGYKLFAYRERNGSIGFDLGDTGVGMGGYSASAFRRPVCVFGPGTTDDTDPYGPIPYFGITSADTASVAVNYPGDRSEQGAAGTGGFVVLLDRNTEPTSITTYDADGSELAEVPLRYEDGSNGPDAIAPSSAFC